jgi:hypothetical protein
MVDGVRVLASEYFDRPEETQPVERASIVRARGLIDTLATVDAGSFGSAQPIAIRSLPLEGAKQFSYVDDYYNRLYFLPRRIELGSISGTVTAPFYVWNARLTNTLIQSITLSGADDITVDGPEPPFTMLPLEVKTFSVTAGEDGSPVLNATLVFDDTISLSPVFISGVRALLTPLRPNWSRSVSITYEYRTEVITSRSGKEQRRALRKTPRKSVGFESIASGALLRQVNEVLTKAQANTVIMPEFPRFARTAAAAAGADVTLQLESVPYWLVADSTAVLVYGERMESRRVASVGEGSVTFASAAGGDPWPVGTMIHWGLSGLFNIELQSRRETNATAVVTVDFKVNPTSELEVAQGLAPVMFNGREVFLKRPNWSEVPTLTFRSQREEVDYGRGKIARFNPVDFVTRVIRATYLGRNLEEADTILEHFKRMKGQRGEFYMPTWEYDLPPKVALQANTRTLRLDGPAIYDTYRDDTVMKAVYIQMNDGSYYMNAVDEVFQITDDIGAGDSALLCTGEWPVTIDPANVVFVSWMPVWRYASDSVTFDWLTNSVCQFQLTMRTVEALPPSIV